jgi:hypothetical protein
MDIRYCAGYRLEPGRHTLTLYVRFGVGVRLSISGRKIGAQTFSSSVTLLDAIIMVKNTAMDLGKFRMIVDGRVQHDSSVFAAQPLKVIASDDQLDIDVDLSSVDEPQSQAQ